MGFNPEFGAFGRRQLSHFCHKVTTSTSGTIASQDEPADSGVIATKTASKTGRYTIQLPDKYRKFCGGFASVRGPDDAVYGAKTKGSMAFFRANDIDSNNLDGTIEVQFVQFSDATNTIDAELPDSTVFFVHLWVEL